jgi:hypothetical protein
MYYPFWKYIKDNPDQWHTLIVPLELQARTIKALRKERWLAGADDAHILVVQSVNNQSIRACWKTHSGLLLADIPIGQLFAPIHKTQVLDTITNSEKEN